MALQHGPLLPQPSEPDNPHPPRCDRTKGRCLPWLGEKRAEIQSQDILIEFQLHYSWHSFSNSFPLTLISLKKGNLSSDYLRWVFGSPCPLFKSRSLSLMSLKEQMSQCVTLHVGGGEPQHYFSIRNCCSISHKHTHGDTHTHTCMQLPCVERVADTEGGITARCESRCWWHHLTTAHAASACLHTRVFLLLFHYNMQKIQIEENERRKKLIKKETILANI